MRMQLKAGAETSHPVEEETTGWTNQANFKPEFIEFLNRKKKVVKKLSISASGGKMPWWTRNLGVFSISFFCYTKMSARMLGFG